MFSLESYIWLHLILYSSSELIELSGESISSLYFHSFLFSFQSKNCSKSGHAYAALIRHPITFGGHFSSSPLHNALDLLTRIIVVSTTCLQFGIFMPNSQQHQCIEAINWTNTLSCMPFLPRGLLTSLACWSMQYWRSLLTPQCYRCLFRHKVALTILLFFRMVRVFLPSLIFLMLLPVLKSMSSSLSSKISSVVAAGLIPACSKNIVSRSK